MNSFFTLLRRHLNLSSMVALAAWGSFPAYLDACQQGDHDYLNASFIESAAGERPAWRYIATQGPLNGTTADFWRMVRLRRLLLLLSHRPHVIGPHSHRQELRGPHMARRSSF